VAPLGTSGARALADSLLARPWCDLPSTAPTADPVGAFRNALEAWTQADADGPAEVADRDRALAMAEFDTLARVTLASSDDPALLFGLAVTASALGRPDTASAATARARTLAADEVRRATAGIDDPTVLLRAEAEARLLALDTRGLPLARLGDVVDRRVRELAAGFDPCDATSAQVDEVETWQALAEAVGAAVPAKLTTAFARWRRQADGVGTLACDALAVVGRHSGDPGGVAVLDLVACDGRTWSGTVQLAGSRRVSGGLFTYRETFEVAVTVPEEGGVGEGSFVTTLEFTGSLEEGDVTGAAPLTGTLTIAIDQDAGLARLSFVHDPTVATIEIGPPGDARETREQLEGNRIDVTAPLLRPTGCDDAA